MFGALGLKIGDKYFAMLYKGQLVVKLPADRVTALVASGDGRYFDPGHGRLMKEWIAFAPALAARWGRLAEEAKGFVESVAAGTKKRGKTVSRTARAGEKAKARRSHRSGR